MATRSATEYGNRPLRTVHTGQGTSYYFANNAAAHLWAEYYWPGITLEIVGAGSEWRLDVPATTKE